MGKLTPVEWGLVLAIFAILAMVLGRFTGCEACSTGPEGVRAVESQGFSQVELGAVSTWRCGRGDSFGNEFTAVNALGKHVTGFVCCGSSGCGKACTVRF